MANTYLDGDGLYRKYGTTKAVATTAGEYKTFGPLREIELKIDLTTLTSSSVIMNDQTFFPKSVYVEEVILEVMVAATSAGSPTLDVGLVQTSDRSTGITNFTNTGFIAAEVLSGVLDTIGKKITYTAGTSKAGAGIALAPAQVGHITARANTATFTAGNVSVKIRYRAYTN